MTDFWTRFNEMAAAAEQTETGKLFAASNFHVGHNGGGCTAWERPVDETGWKVLITDSEGFSHESEDGKWIVGAHHESGEFVERCVEADSIAAAIAAADAFDVVLSGKIAEPDATITDKIRLAREFGTLIQEELSTVRFRAMVDRNKAEDADSNVCHSHDYCDANMTMLQAFQNVFQREPAFLNDSTTEADLALWNEAWQIAKAADFFA